MVPGVLCPSAVGDGAGEGGCAACQRYRGPRRGFGGPGAHPGGCARGAGDCGAGEGTRVPVEVKTGNAFQR